MPIPRQRIIDLVEAADDYCNGILEIQRRALNALKNDVDLRTFLIGLTSVPSSEFLQYPEKTTRTLATELENRRITEARAHWRRTKKSQLIHELEVLSKFEALGEPLITSMLEKGKSDE